MRNSLYPRTLFAMVLLFIANAVLSDQNTKEGYALGTPDKTVVRNNFNGCWRTGFWTPDMAIAECDPGLVKVANVEPPVTPSAPPPLGPQALVLTLKSNILFVFDSWFVDAEGKQELDNHIIAKLKEYPQIEMVQITGHADRIGSEAYNQELSQRRADAVKDYLVGQGIVSSRTETTGRGELDPVVSCTDVAGESNHTNRNLIECLKPNRRVVVEIMPHAIERQ